MVVDEVVHLPKSVGILLVGAAAGDGCGPGPRMKLLKRKIFEDQSHLACIVRKHAAQYVVKAAADRALEVRVFHERNRSLGVAKRGRAVHLDLCPIFCEWVFRHIRQFTTEEKLAVLTNVKLDRFLIVADGQVDIRFEQPIDR